MKNKSSKSTRKSSNFKKNKSANGAGADKGMPRWLKKKLAEDSAYADFESGSEKQAKLAAKAPKDKSKAKISDAQEFTPERKKYRADDRFSERGKFKRERSGRFGGKQERRPASPTVLDIQITGIDRDGEAFAMPVDKRLKGKFAKITVAGMTDVKSGDVVTAKLMPDEAQPGIFTAKIIAKHEKGETASFLAVVESLRHETAIRPLNKALAGVRFCAIEVPSADIIDGSVVRVRPLGHIGKSRDAHPVEIIEHLGSSPLGLETAIAIENHEIAGPFPDEVLDYAEKLPAKLTKDELAEREDLRHLPIITIDGADAKDFDDAVWAQAVTPGDIMHPQNAAYHMIVAIADVAHYVAEGSALDIEAQLRGNSTYFPDRVVPMLPERLSNDLCSLRPHEDRPVMACHMWIDARGKLLKYEFSRAVIHSHARLTYEQAQEALEGNPSELTRHVLECTIRPLYNAYQLLLKARKSRSALDLDIPETYIVMDDNGAITALSPRARVDSHKLIEELMILANVAAASALENVGGPCLYRIHPEPSQQKLDNLKLVLKSHGMKLADNAQIQPQTYQKLVDQAKDHASADALMQAILQSQQQARYEVDNIGHFGLALQRYAHFTSPIRRYADLVVHRSLIKHCKLVGKGELKSSLKQVEAIAEHINKTERRSQLAEWEAKDRMTVRFYHDFVGKQFEARIVSIQKFGMFVSVENAAEGLVPMRLMHGDHYIFNPKNLTLLGKRSKKSLKIGDKIQVKLTEADPVVGRLTFSMT